MNQSYGHDMQAFQDKYASILSGQMEHDRDANYIEEVSIIKTYLKSGRYLDVGCHAGWLLGYLQKHTDLELVGLEPSRELARFTADRLRIRVINDYVQEGVLDRETFDFVGMTDVFEHIPNPCQVLRALHGALKKDGKLMIKVPNGSFSLLKYRLKNVFPFLIHAMDTFDAKEHLVHYTPVTIVRILEQNGFNVLMRKTPRPVQTRGSSAPVMLARKTFYRLGTMGLLPPQDILVVAKKA